MTKEEFFVLCKPEGLLTGTVRILIFLARLIVKCQWIKAKHGQKVGLGIALLHM